MLVDYFGFFPEPLCIDSDDYSIRPTRHFEKAKALVAKEAHQDGFLYQPGSWMTRDGKVIPNTHRPARFTCPFVSHEIRVKSRATKQKLRNDKSGFLIHLLGSLYGVRLQFNDWRLDLRVPVRPRSGFVARAEDVRECLDTCLERWTAWSPATRRRMISILIMFQRAPCYEWEWEHLSAEYMVFDACFQLADVHYGLVARYAKGGKRLRHSDRLSVMSREFGLCRDRARLASIARMRNNLLHECRWDRGNPYSARSNRAFMLPRHFNRFNHRLILSMLGYRTAYTKTAWWTLGWSALNP
jgi:hypothetical protein